MGGAIARGLAQGSLVAPKDLTVSNPSKTKLNDLKQAYPDIHITHSNTEAASHADLVILAVKPWLVETVLNEMKLRKKQILISVAAGVSFEKLAEYTLQPEMTLFRVIPNTAISQLQSMTLIAAHQASAEQEKLLMDLFNEMGMAVIIPEEKMAAATSLTSCGIAYVLKYIQAATQAGVELGIYPKDAMRMVAQSVKGAAELILNQDTHPSVEIDKVCTPGGLTIKGINELEHHGFGSAIIQAIKKSM